MHAENEAGMVSERGMEPVKGRPWRVTRRGLLKLAIALVWIPVAAELFLRYLAPVPLMPRYVVAAPYGVRANQASVVYYHTTPDVHIRMETNSKGVRADREIPYEKPAGVKRIVAIGDSYGMGYEVTLEDTYLSVMERELNAAGIKAEVVNLSVSGHGTAEELITLREEGLKYDPDLVLVSWTDTDPEDDSRSSLFRLVDGKLVADKTTFLPGTAAQEKLAKYALYRWASENCQLYSFARETAAGFAKSLLSTLRSLKSGGSAPTIEPEPEAGTAVAAETEKPAELSPKQELNVALLKEVQRVANEHGSQMLVLDVPDSYAIGHYFSLFPVDPEGRDFGLRVVRPLTAFQAQGDTVLYWQRGHFHLTPFACNMVGKMLAQAIIEQRLLGETGESLAVAPQ